MSEKRESMSHKSTANCSNDSKPAKRLEMIEKQDSDSTACIIINRDMDWRSTDR